MVMTLVEFIVRHYDAIRGTGFALVGTGSLLLVVGLLRRN